MGRPIADRRSHQSAAALLHQHPAPDLTALALIHGYTTGFWVAAAIFAAGAVVCGSVFRPGPVATTPSPADSPAATPAGGAGPQPRPAPSLHH